MTTTGEGRDRIIEEKKEAVYGTLIWKEDEFCYAIQMNDGKMHEIPPHLQYKFPHFMGEKRNKVEGA